jgi:hypothetical protein
LAIRQTFRVFGKYVHEIIHRLSRKLERKTRRASLPPKQVGSAAIASAIRLTDHSAGALAATARRLLVLSSFSSLALALFVDEVLIRPGIGRISSVKENVAIS